MKRLTQLAAWLSSCAVVALSPTTAAQTVLLEVGGTLPGEGFGTSVARVGDLDGDGRDDVAVGAPGYAGGLGRVQILSGLDGSALLEVIGPAAGERFAEFIDSGEDVSGDGVVDLGIGSPGAKSGFGAARAYSGVDGSLLFDAWSGGCWTMAEFGWAVELIGDFDGDGLADFGVGTNCDSYEDGCSAVVASYRPGLPQDNQLLWSSAGCNCWCPDSFGIALDGGDFNGDGFEDVAVGKHVWPNFDVQVFYGPTGTPGWAEFVNGSYQLTYPEHAWVSTLGDVNGDGRDDIAIAEITTTGGDVRVLSGADGQELASILSTGNRLAAAGDFDGDGVRDLVIGHPQESTAGVDAGAVYVYSVANGLLATFYGDGPGEEFGSSVDGAGDVNGDGVDDILVGAAGAGTPGGAGYVRVISGNAAPTPSTYCLGKVNSQGCLPFIDWGGSPTMTGADDFLVLTRDALLGKPGLFFYGLDGVIDVPFLGGSLCVRPPLVRTLPANAMGLTDCEAGNVFHFNQALMAAEGLQAGNVVQGQFWMRDPTHADGTGVGLTNAITIPILP